MAQLVEYKPKGLPDYLDRVERLQLSAGTALWFRGAATARHKLVPSLYRHPTITADADTQVLERQLMVRFRQRGLPYHTRDLRDDWEALFFMQHYGVPTRLLDWTENPLTGLYFALMARRADANPGPAAVWVLNPELWNRTSLSHVSYSGAPLTAGDDPLKGYAPQSSGGVLNAHPVALYGTHNSARIVAQQGVFAIFGKNRTPMEALVRSGTFPPGALCRILIPQTRITSMRTSLLNQGITESTVFPDLEGLALETKRHFGFDP